MASKKPRIDPVMAALTRHRNESTAELSGFVGEVTARTIKLYPSRTATAYVEVPVADIVHFVDGVESSGPTVLFVKASAEVRVVVSKEKTVEAGKLRLSERHERESCDCESGYGSREARAPRRPFGPDGGLTLSPGDFCVPRCDRRRQFCETFTPWKDCDLAELECLLGCEL